MSTMHSNTATEVKEFKLYRISHNDRVRLRDLRIIHVFYSERESLQSLPEATLLQIYKNLSWVNRDICVQQQLEIKSIIIVTHGLI